MDVVTTNSNFIEKFSSTNKKKKREDSNKIRNERGDITTDTTDTKDQKRLL